MSQSITATISLSDIAAGRGGFFILGKDQGRGSLVQPDPAGDLNDDGIADIAIGFPAGDFPSSRGTAFVVFGSTGGGDALTDLRDVAAGNGGFAIRAARDYDRVSSAIGVGDVNGDGIDDLAISAEGSFFGGRGSGSLFVVYGSDTGFGAEIDLLDIELGTRAGAFSAGLNTHDQSDLVLAAVGDVNGDGLDDILVGDAPDDGYPGNGYLVFGRAGGLGLPANLTTIGATGRGVVLVGSLDAEQGDARSVDGLGDIDRDGFADFVVRSFEESFFIFGGASLPGSIALQNLTADQGFATDAFFVQRAGDVNGDGVPDYIRGDRNPFEIGIASVILGRVDGPPDFATADTIFRAPREGVSAGSVAGDFNGDGIDDLLVRTFLPGTFSLDPEAVEVATIVFGRRGGLPAEVDLATVANGVDGVRLDNDIGVRLRYFAAVGDVNADGYDDLTFGAPDVDAADGTRNNAGGNAGGVYVVYGRPSAAPDTRGTDGDDMLTGTGAANALTGLGGDDLLRGLGGQDTLRGGAGRDTLEGGAGDDQLRLGAGDRATGGAGRDGFLLLADAPGALITITDFARAEGDSLNFARIDADAFSPGDQAFAWIGRARFSGTAGELRWDRPAGATGRDSRLLGDTDGDRVADVVVLLEGVDGVRESWFVLIAVFAWVAGLFYLPRLYVYHSVATVGSEVSGTFVTMERLLLRAIMNPAM